MGLSGLDRSSLSSNSTRFDLLNAAPSTTELRIIWITWAALSGIVGILVIIFILGILSSRKARRRSFNVYILFITLPDTMFSIACCITCVLNAVHGHYIADWMCSVQAVIVSFSFCANGWLNAVVIRHVHTMLKCSSNREKYNPPKLKTVFVSVACVYAFAAIVSTFSLFKTPVHRHSATRGLACLPLEYNLQSSLFFWLCFVWLLMGIPIVYVFYVWYDVRKRGLLPSGGRTRSVAIFFARLTAVFVIMWLPTLGFIYLGSQMNEPWGAFSGGVWSHLQPAVSAGVCMLKRDIGQAVTRFVRCRCNQKDRRDSLTSVAETTPNILVFGNLEAVLEEGATNGEGGDVSSQEQPYNRREQMERRSSLFGSFIFYSDRDTFADNDTLPTTAATAGSSTTTTGATLTTTLLSTTKKLRNIFALSLSRSRPSTVDEEGEEEEDSNNGETGLEGGLEEEGE